MREGCQIKPKGKTRKKERKRQRKCQYTSEKRGKEFKEVNVEKKKSKKTQTGRSCCKHQEEEEMTDYASGKNIYLKEFQAARVR